MLLSTSIQQPLVGSAMLLDPFRHNLSSHETAMLKTAQHNNFLSLLKPDRRSSNAVHLRPAQSIVKARASSKSTARINSQSPSVQFGSSLRPKALRHESSEVSSSSDTESDLESQKSKDVEPSSQTSTDLDGDIDMLIAGINDRVAIEDRAVLDHTGIEVPKSFETVSEVGAAEVHKTRMDIRLHVKRKRQEGLLPKALGNDWRNGGGFKPQEIISSNAVSLPDCRGSNLNNKIHPLLQRSHWDNTPDAIYDQLVPALRLATQFLTQPICMKFWVTVALGGRSDDAEMASKYGKRCQRISSHVPLTPINTTEIIKHLHELGDANIIHFAFKEKLHQETGGGVWATSGPICDYLGVRHHSKAPKLTRSIIRFHADHYIIAKKLSQLKYPEVSQQLRFSFFFASLVMHELAHSIEGAYIRMRNEQWAEFQRSRTYLEPFWLDWQRPPECGKAWEATLFGGEIQPVNNRVDGSHGVSVCDWPPRGTREDEERRTWYTVPMSYIEGLFQRSTWEKSYDLEKDGNVFFVPRSGAKSFYINWFTTMRFREGEKAREEVAELVKVVKEQPPKKVRVKGKGNKEEQRRVKIEEVLGKVEPDPTERTEDLEGGSKQQVEDGNARTSAPIFQQTRRLSTVMPRGLLTSREDGEEDKADGITCQLLDRIAESNELRPIEKHWVPPQIGKREAKLAKKRNEKSPEA